MTAADDQFFEAGFFERQLVVTGWPEWMPQEVREFVVRFSESAYVATPPGGKLEACVGPDPWSRSYLASYSMRVGDRLYVVTRTATKIDVRQRQERVQGLAGSGADAHPEGRDMNVLCKEALSWLLSEGPLERSREVKIVRPEDGHWIHADSDTGRFAIWARTGAVHRVQEEGDEHPEAVEEIPIWVPPNVTYSGEASISTEHGFHSSFQMNTYVAVVEYPEGWRVAVLLPPNARSVGRPEGWRVPVLVKASQLLQAGKTQGTLP